VKRYTGDDGPTWSGHPVRIEERTVLVVIVEPPLDGDPIHTLRREWTSNDKTKKGYQEGAIFVRHQARSLQASSADVAALQRRILAGTNGPQQWMK
jgi:hypothetical protein